MGGKVITGKVGSCRAIDKLASRSIYMQLHQKQ